MSEWVGGKHLWGKKWKEESLDLDWRTKWYDSSYLYMDTQFIGRLWSLKILLLPTALPYFICSEHFSHLVNKMKIFHTLFFSRVSTGGWSLPTSHSASIVYLLALLHLKFWTTKTMVKAGRRKIFNLWHWAPILLVSQISRKNGGIKFALQFFAKLLLHHHIRHWSNGLVSLISLGQHCLHGAVRNNCTLHLPILL